MKSEIKRNKRNSKNQLHTISPIFDNNSRILILGSFPSVKSREVEFYYGHPQNRFWQVLSSVLGCELPNSTQQKIKMLLDNNIALWDVIERCDIVGSDDSSIKNVVPNDLSMIFETANIEKVYTNGGKADTLYKKYCQKKYDKPVIKLPSTSPANARYRLEDLVIEWDKIIK